ncbi:MAG: 23S rRNA (adenine(2503)-C(2))-methyltransferase RlmN [Treponema sp.]|jgi:23S rRNA (adenine2503-C2)-methyltransferase|nr:23S rRNA (adenine(2503)-C(2))-methyltransferase RlmN [Treponema sp.]
MTPRELEALLGAFGEKKFRAAQIFSWIARGAVSFDEMANLPLSLRKQLESAYRLRSTSVTGTLRGADGTVKLRLRLDDGAAVEAVLLAARETGGDGDGGRFTACLSTQAGCPVGCVFCKTGSLGFRRNLNAAEIVEQFLALNSVSKGGVSNIVVMGMGEPLLNLEALGKAFGIIVCPEGAGLSKRRITVSTSGIESGIYALAEKGPPVELAVSLVTAREDLRRRLMPFAGLAGLEGLKKALAAWQRRRGRRVTLETVLLGGINTTADDAEALVRFARGLKAAVNVIPWNPVEGLLFEGKALRAPERAEIDRFRARLEAAGLTVTRRYRRGQEIAGACGQLGGG